MYNSISAGYDARTEAIWDSLNAPEFECCEMCKGWIPNGIECYTYLKDNIAFCSSLCCADWVEEFGWQYEE